MPVSSTCTRIFIFVRHSVCLSVCLFGISLLFKYLHVLNKFIAKSLICQRSYLCCRLAGPLFILVCVFSWSPWYVSCLSNHIFDSDILWNSLLAVQQTRRVFIEGLNICCSTGQEGDQPTGQPSDWPLTERWQLLLLQIFDLFLLGCRWPCRRFVPLAMAVAVSPLSEMTMCRDISGVPENVPSCMHERLPSHLCSKCAKSLFGVPLMLHYLPLIRGFSIWFNECEFPYVPCVCVLSGHRW